MLCVLSHDLNTINGRVAFQPCILGIQDVGPTSGGVGGGLLPAFDCHGNWRQIAKGVPFQLNAITRDFDPKLGIGFRIFQGTVGHPS